MPDDVHSELLLAVYQFITEPEGSFSASQWTELGLYTGTTALITRHPRLLRSLSFGDDDYGQQVIEVLPKVLGDSRDEDDALRDRYPGISGVEHFGFLEWVKDRYPAVYRELADEPLQLAALPIDDLEVVARRLNATYVEEHSRRIRASLQTDQAQAMGAAKELLESVLKAGLGLHGTGKETQRDLPELLRMSNDKLDLRASNVPADEPGAVHRKKALSGLTNIVLGVGELRNRGYATGHGVSQRPELDSATARMVVGAAVIAATYYVEAFAAEAARGDSLASSPQQPRSPEWA